MKTNNLMKVFIVRIILIVIIIYSQTLYPQISVSQNEFMSIFTPGKVFYATDRIPGQVDIGKTHGPNIYDFTSIDTQNLITISNYLVNDIAYLAERYPSNSITFGNSLSEIVENPVFLIKGDSIFISGYATISDNNRFVHHSPDELFSVFPLTYGLRSFWQEMDVSDTTFNSAGQVSENYFYHDLRTTGVDGYGTLKLPGRELECIRLRRDYSWFQFKEFYYITKEGFLVVVANVPSAAPDSGYVAGEKQILISSSAVSVVSKEKTPGEFILYQNYPNPFNPITIIRYSIPEQTFIELKLYDMLGREVKTLIKKNQPQGNYEVRLDLKSVPSGVYFYRLKAGNYVKTKKMILMR